MKNIIITVFKALRKVGSLLITHIYTPIARAQFFLNGAELKGKMKVNGFIKVNITRRGKLSIGKSLRLNGGNNHNIIGRQQKCIFWVEGNLGIGDNVGMSATAIICNHNIKIGNNVIIGGNTVIYDTDFHSLVPEIRADMNLDKNNANWAPVVIADNVFIGAHSTILKGVNIGKNAIIGACSVIAKNIPEDEIWAGNPARFIKKIKNIY